MGSSVSSGNEKTKTKIDSNDKTFQQSISKWNATIEKKFEKNEKEQIEIILSEEEKNNPSWTITEIKAKYGYSTRVIVVLALLLFILAAVLLVLVCVFLFASPVEVHGGVWAVFDLDNICDKLPPGTNCQGTNPLTPYSRCLWPFLGDKPSGFASSENSNDFLAHLMGAHEMSAYDAIIIYGLVPIGYLYWAITLYLYDIPSSAKGSIDGRLSLIASIGDSVSSARVTAETAPYIAVVLSANPNMVKIAYETFLKSWDQVAKPIQMWKIVIPTKMWNPGFRYNVFGRVTLQNLCEVLPVFECNWYQDKTVQVDFSPLGTPLIPRGISPNERITIFPLNEWYTVAAQLVAETYTIQQGPVKANPQGWPEIPDGIDFGYQCLAAQRTCNGDNRDTLYWNAFNLIVSKQQAVVVVALNHIATMKALVYCNLAFSDQTTAQGYTSVITGQAPENPPLYVPPATWKDAVRIVYNVPPDTIFQSNGLAYVYVTERIYVSNTTVGPTYNTTLPLVCFVVAKLPSLEESQQMLVQQEQEQNNSNNTTNQSQTTPNMPIIDSISMINNMNENINVPIPETGDTPIIHVASLK